MVLVGGVFENGALTNGVSAFMEEAPGRALVPSSTWGRNGNVHNPGGGPQPTMLVPWSQISHPGNSEQ